MKNLPRWVFSASLVIQLANAQVAKEFKDERKLLQSSNALSAAMQRTFNYQARREIGRKNLSLVKCLRAKSVESRSMDLMHLKGIKSSRSIFKKRTSTFGSSDFSTIPFSPKRIERTTQAPTPTVLAKPSNSNKSTCEFFSNHEEQSG